jgi:type IV secretory pathway VirB9-like protein
MLKRFVVGAFVMGQVASSVTLQAEGIREVRYTDKMSIAITAQQRFGTVIVLPKEEAIVDALCGDKEFWIIDEVKNAPNAVSVKPARPGAASNLHLVAASGRIYTFSLREGAAKADDKVFVVPDETAFAQTARHYYSEDDYNAVRGQLAEAQAAASKAKADAAQTVEALRALYPTQLRFDYTFSPPPSAFGVRAVWHDERFTYVDVRARELPALYEERDGQPNVPDYQVQDGHLYVVPHVVDRGYLMIGSKKWPFRLSHD